MDGFAEECNHAAIEDLKEILPFGTALLMAMCSVLSSQLTERTTDYMNKIKVLLIQNFIICAKIRKRIDVDKIPKRITKKMGILPHKWFHIGLTMVMIVIIAVSGHSVGITIPITERVRLSFLHIFLALYFANPAVNSFRELILISKYPVIVQKTFSEPIFIDTLYDIIGWWQLRHYYKSYEIPAKLDNISWIVTIYLSLCLLFIAYCAMDVITNGFGEQNPVGVTGLIATGLLMCILFYVVISVLFNYKEAYNEETKIQIIMLKREKLRLQLLNKEKYQDIIDIIDVIKDEMLIDYAPYRILNIAVTPNTFLALKTSISAAAAATFAAYIKNHA